MKTIKTILTCLLLVGMFQSLMAQTAGAPYLVPTNSQSSGGSAIVSGYTCSTGSAGTMTVGTAVTGVTQTITAQVVTVGTYSISITANGVTFAASGTFTGTGNQNIVLTATGTPSAPGTHAFTLNTTPNCTFDRSTTMTPLPPNITIRQISDYYIASIFDNDYTPYTAPTSAAQLPSGPTSEAANGINEATLINVQGRITTWGVPINLRYTVSVATVNLPAYSQTINIPAAYTEDGISRDVTFSYNAISLPVGTGNIQATLKSLGGDLNIKKLDIQSGIGNDNLGLLLAQFSYSRNSAGDFFSFGLRAIAGIIDRAFNQTINGDNNHNFIYLPITAEDGNIWLNNNLGAQYANINHASFNPAMQATSSSDFNAFGSLFQWGRQADGHEITQWTNSTTVTLTTASSWSNSTSYQNRSKRWENSYSAPHLWYHPVLIGLWQGENGVNNPCPIGFRLPTYDEITNLRDITGFSDMASVYNNTSLRLPSAGQRIAFISPQFPIGGNLTIPYVNYWTGTMDTGDYIYCLLGHTFATQQPAMGASVRCIKN